MRRRGGELGVAVGRLEPALGQRRVVIGMDEVVHHARMVRLAHDLRLQDLGRLELLGVGLVGRQRGHVEREGIVDRGLASRPDSGRGAAPSPASYARTRVR